MKKIGLCHTCKNAKEHSNIEYECTAWGSCDPDMPVRILRSSPVGKCVNYKATEVSKEFYKDKAPFPDTRSDVGENIEGLNWSGCCFYCAWVKQCSYLSDSEQWCYVHKTYVLGTMMCPLFHSHWNRKVVPGRRDPGYRHKCANDIYRAEPEPEQEILETSRFRK